MLRVATPIRCAAVFALVLVAGCPDYGRPDPVEEDRDGGQDVDDAGDADSGDDVPDANWADPCAANGEACSDGCCSGACKDNVCVENPGCGLEGYDCRFHTHCCGGLVCDIPEGTGGLGTCGPPRDCRPAGEACSPEALCCGEGVQLVCLDSQGMYCDGGACSCEYLLPVRSEESR